MISRDHALPEAEEAWVRHELHPDSCEYDCNGCQHWDEEIGRRKSIHTGSSELSIQSFPQNTLNTQTSTHERETNERSHVRPRRIVSSVRYTRLAALPKSNSSSHGEHRLDEGADDEPYTLVGTHTVTNAAYERAGIEGD